MDSHAKGALLRVSVAFVTLVSLCALSVPYLKRLKDPPTTETFMKIRPLADRILVERDPEEVKTAGGIYIPETAKEKATKATVKAVGPGRVTSDGVLVPMNVRVGDKILFGKYSGSEIEVDGEKLLMMREEDILGVVEK